MKTISFRLIFLILAIVALATSTWVPVTKVSTHPDNVNENDQYPQIAADAAREFLYSLEWI